MGSGSSSSKGATKKSAGKH